MKKLIILFLLLTSCISTAQRDFRTIRASRTTESMVKDSLLVMEDNGDFKYLKYSNLLTHLNNDLTIVGGATSAPNSEILFGTGGSTTSSSDFTLNTTGNVVTLTDGVYISNRSDLGNHISLRYLNDVYLQIGTAPGYGAKITNFKAEPLSISSPLGTTEMDNVVTTNSIAELDALGVKAFPSIEWITSQGFGSGGAFEFEGIGVVRAGRVAENYGSAGSNAFDNTISYSASTTKGATGVSSFAHGYDNTASGSNSSVLGQGNTAGSTTSFVVGQANDVLGSAVSSSILGGVSNTINTTASNSTILGGANNVIDGAWSTVIGGSNNQVKSHYGLAGNIHNISQSFGETALGTYSTNYTPNSVGSYNVGDRVFNIGNGTATGARADAFTIIKSGLVGIGFDNFETTVDTEILQVNGNINATQYIGDGSQLTGIVGDGFEANTDNQTAAQVTNTTSGNLTSTNVQSSLEELQGDIDALGAGSADGVITNIEVVGPDLVIDGVLGAETVDIPLTSFHDGYEPNTDTQLTELEVDAYADNNGYLESTDLAITDQYVVVGTGTGIEGTVGFQYTGGALILGEPTVAQQPRITMLHDANTALGWIFGYTGSASNDFYHYTNEPNADYIVYTNGLERFRIASTGAVTVTNDLTSNSFIKAAATSDDILLGDGTTTSLAGITAPVDSVNTQTGVVVLDADDIDDTSTLHKFVTEAQRTQISNNEADINTIESEQITQNSAIALNTVKETNIAHPLVETAVPLGALFTDTVYDDTAIQAEVDLNTIFKTTPSTEITAGTNLSWSGNTLNATGGGQTPVSLTNNTVIQLDNTINSYYTDSGNTADVYTLGTVVLGGKANVFIDTSGDTAFPTVTGATFIPSAPFGAGKTYLMNVYNDGNTIYYYFVALAQPEEIYFFEWGLSGEKTDIAVETAVMTDHAPFDFEIKEIRINSSVAPVGSSITVDINKNAVSIFTTEITIDAGDKKSEDSGTGYTVNTATFSDGDEITFDIDGIGSTTAGQGLKAKIYYVKL